MNLETRPLWKRIVAIVIPIGGVILVLQSAFSVYSLWRKGDIVEEKRASLQRLEREQETLKKDLSLTYTQGFIEQEARNKLGLVKPGETIVYVTQDATNTAKSTVEVQTEEKTTLTPLQQWIKLFF